MRSGTDDGLAVGRPGGGSQKMTIAIGDQRFPLVSLDGINHQSKLAQLGVVIHDICQTAPVRGERDVGVYVGDQLLGSAPQDWRPIEVAQRLSRLTADKIKIVAIRGEL